MAISKARRTEQIRLEVSETLTARRLYLGYTPRSMGLQVAGSWGVTYPAARRKVLSFDSAERISELGGMKKDAYRRFVADFSVYCDALGLNAFDRKVLEGELRELRDNFRFVETSVEPVQRKPVLDRELSMIAQALYTGGISSDDVRMLRRTLESA